MSEPTRARAADPAALLRGCDRAAGEALRIAVVAAHPDDESIGVGARLAEWSDAYVVQVSDGAPSDLRDARRQGLESRDAYVALRRRERAAALTVAGLDATRVYDLDFVDQDCSHHLATLANRLAVLLGTLRPNAVITHPYEGGHPDHDAVAFAVHAAVERLRRDDDHAPLVLEMTSYHAGPTGISTGCFLPNHTGASVAGILSDAQAARKRRMLACYRSQRETLGWFDCRLEPLRVAPRYTFDVPPHPGTLFYERFDWGMTGDRWRALARAAARDLELRALVA